MRPLRSRLRRLLVLAVTAMSFLVGRLADADHLLTTAHVVCAEHGGQIEEQAVGAAAPAEAGIRQDVSGPESHHACDMPLAFASAGAAVLPRMAGLLPEPPAEGASSAVVAARAGMGALPVLAVAPKQGPPQA